MFFFSEIFMKKKKKNKKKNKEMRYITVITLSTWADMHLKTV